MAEQTLMDTPQAQQQTNQQTQTPAQATPPPEKKVDLVTRVSQVKKPDTQQQTQTDIGTENTFGLTKEDYDKVKTDPVLSKFYKSMHSDYIKKTQSIADEKKTIEKLKSDYSTWDVNKVGTILKDPNFVQAAQTYMQTQKPSNFQGSQEDWSALSDAEKQNIEAMNQRLVQLEQQNYTSQIKQQDTELQTKYTNYDSKAIDTLTAELLAGKVQATREHLWKVYDYDDAVNRAYQLGLQDKKLEVTDRLNANTIEGVTTQNASDRPTPNKGESDRDFLARVFKYNQEQVSLNMRK